MTARDSALQSPRRRSVRHNKRGGSKDTSAYHSPRSVDEVTRLNVKTVHDLDAKAQAAHTMLDRVATKIAAFAGSPTFIVLHVVWFGAWIGWNAMATRRFDPFPYTFLTLVVSLEAIFLSAFILMSQNLAARVTERRGALDLQINLLSEQENTKVLSLVQKIARQVGVKDCEDPSVTVLEQATRPERLAEQIDALMEEREKRERES